MIAKAVALCRWPTCGPARPSLPAPTNAWLAAVYTLVGAATGSAVQARGTHTNDGVECGVAGDVAAVLNGREVVSAAYVH